MRTIPRTSLWSSRALAALALTLVTLAVAGAALAQNGEPRKTVPGDPKLEALLTRFREAQQTTKTMAASFRQVKEDDLFAEPSVQSGKFYFMHPSDFRWEYVQPEPVVVLATKDQVRRYLPREGLVKETDISRNRRRVFNYFGIGSDVDNLRRHFNITFNATDTTYPTADKIELRGKRKRVQKRIEVLEMWIDKATALPATIRVVMADGGTTTWEFTDLKVNPPLQKEIYELKLAPGTTVEHDDGKTDVTPLIDDIIDDEDDEASGPGPTKQPTAG